MISLGLMMKFFKRYIVLLFAVMMLSGCAYVTMSLTVGSATTIIVGSAMGVHHRMKQETQDSIRQAITDSLKQEYPTVSEDSLPKMVADVIQKKEEQRKEARLNNFVGVLLGLGAVTAVLIFFVLPFGASPGLGD